MLLQTFNGAGSGSNLNVIIIKGGHGKDVVKELGGFFVMLNKSLVGIEGTSDIGVVNDFRRIGLIRNQLTLVHQQLQVLIQEDNFLDSIFSSVSGTFTVDEEINQASTGVVVKL